MPACKAAARATVPDHTSDRVTSSPLSKNRAPLQLGDLPEECLDKIFEYASFHVTHVTDDYQPYPLLYPNAYKLPRLSRRFYDTASNALWRYICIEDTEEATALRLFSLGNALDAWQPAIQTNLPVSRAPAQRVRGIRLFLDDAWPARDTFKRTLALLLHVCPRLIIVNLVGAWSEESSLLPSLASAFGNAQAVRDLRLHLYHNKLCVQWKSIVELLALLPQLQYLDIDAEVSPQGAEVLEENASLGHLVHLRTSCLPPEVALRLLKQTPSLKRLYWVVHGPWSNDTVAPLQFGELPNLNNLQINAERVLAPIQINIVLFHFPELETFTLEYCNATDELMQSIPCNVRFLSLLFQRGSPWFFLRWLAESNWLKKLQHCQVVFAPAVNDETWAAGTLRGKRHRRPETSDEWHDFEDLEAMLHQACRERPLPVLESSFECI